jgi:hypothetical protein
LLGFVSVPIAHDPLGVLASEEELDRLLQRVVEDAVEPHRLALGLEIIALDHDAVRRWLPLNLSNLGTRPSMCWAIQSANAAG